MLPLSVRLFEFPSLPAVQATRQDYQAANWHKPSARSVASIGTRVTCIATAMAVGTTRLDRWNDMNRHYLEWLQAHPQQGIVARSEDMMSPEDARQQYQRIGEHFDLQRRSEHIYVLQRRVNDTQQFLRRLMNFGYCAQRQ